MLPHTATSLFFEERGNSVISVPQLPGNQGEGKWSSPLSSRGAFSKVRGRTRDERVYRIDRRCHRRQRRVPGALLGDESQWRKVNSLSLLVRSRRVARRAAEFCAMPLAAHTKANGANEGKDSADHPLSGWCLSPNPITYDIQPSEFPSSTAFIESHNFNCGL